MPKEEVREITMEEMFGKLFFETEEERQDRLQEEYQINNSEGIDKLLASNLSYRDKLMVLNREKERVNSLNYELEEAEAYASPSMFVYPKSGYLTILYETTFDPS